MIDIEQHDEANRSTFWADIRLFALTWGAETFLVPPVAHTDDMVGQVQTALREITRCQVGDLVVIVAGSPPGTPGRTNALRVHRIGDAVDS